MLRHETADGRAEECDQTTRLLGQVYEMMSQQQRALQEQALEIKELSRGQARIESFIFRTSARAEAPPTQTSSDMNLSNQSHATDISAPEPTQETRVKSYSYLTSHTGQFQQAGRKLTAKFWKWQGMAQFVSSPTFDLLIGIVIILDMLTLGVQLEFHGRAYEEELRGNDSPDNLNFTFLALQVTLGFVYWIEFALRVGASGAKYFAKVANLCDVLILVTCTAELCVTATSGEAMNSFRAVRIIRLSRLFHMLKILRLLAVCRELYQILQTLKSSVICLLWSMAFIALCIWGWSLIMCVLVDHSLQDESLDPDLRRWGHENFGTLLRSLVSIFECTFSTKWIQLARPMIFDFHWFWSIPWVIFVTCVNFTIIRVISAMFVRQALSISRDEESRLAALRFKKHQEVKDMLQKVFKIGDDSEKGFLSQEDFERLAQRRDVRGMMNDIDVDSEEMIMLSHLMSENGGVLELNEMVAAATKMQTAQSMDTIQILHELMMISKVLMEVRASGGPLQQARETPASGEPVRQVDLREADCSRAHCTSGAGGSKSFPE